MCLRENTQGSTCHRFSQPTALCPSTFMLQPPIPQKLHLCQPPRRCFENYPKQVSILPPAGDFMKLASPSILPPFPSSSHHHSPHTLFLLGVIGHIINTLSTGRVSRELVRAKCRSIRKHGCANTALHCLFLPFWGKVM